MSEHTNQPNAEYDLPEELIGASSKWRKDGWWNFEDGERVESNHITYLVDPVTGKKTAISRNRFDEEFPIPDSDDSESVENDNTFSLANRRTLRDVEREEKQQKDEKKKSRLRKLGKVAAGALIGGAIAITSVFGRDGDHTKYHDTTPVGQTPTELSVPAPYAGEPDYIITEAPVTVSEEMNATPIPIVSVETSEASTPLPTAEMTEPAATPTSTPAPEITPPIITPASVESTEETSSPVASVEATAMPETDQEDTEIKIVPIEGSAVVPDTDESSVSSVESAEETETSPPVEQIQPSNPETTESSSPQIVPVEGSTNITQEEDAASETEPGIENHERLTDFVPVAPGDGITQVLGKVITQAGYKCPAPEKLYELYEELVTNPAIGPNKIFKGEFPAVEWNNDAKEWQLEGTGVTQLTGEAAAVVASELGNQ